MMAEQDLNQTSGRVLVLGANGFIGSYLVEYLAAQQGLKVRAFDRFSKEPQFELRPNIEVYKGDIFNEDNLGDAMRDVDYVMHSFSATTPFISDKDPYVDVTSNLLLSIKIFDLCAVKGIKKIGFISSGGAVYGNLAEQKVAYETDPPLPVSPYGINKLSIEHYLEYYKRTHGTDYVVYRLSNPYGPRQIAKHNQGVVPTFLGKIRNGEEITIYGNGDMSRDYIYITDAAGMIGDSFLRDNTHAVYNIGSGVQTSLNDILRALDELVDTEVQVSYKEAPKTFLSHTSISIERFVNEFGPREFMALRDGLAATIAAAN